MNRGRSDLPQSPEDGGTGLAPTPFPGPALPGRLAPRPAQPLCVLPQFLIPEDDTTYACTFLPLPIVSKKHHIYKVTWAACQDIVGALEGRTLCVVDAEAGVTVGQRLEGKSRGQRGGRTTLGGVVAS